MSATISVCTILKNEAPHIKRYLQDISGFVDEIIIVDTGSSDGTVELVKDAAAHDPKISLYPYVFEGGFHFGRARNYSMERATMDYILILDADYIMSEEFRSGVKDFLERERPMVAAVRRVDDLLRHFVEYPEVIAKNHQNIFYGIGDEYKIHERMVHNFPIKTCDAVIWHSQRQNHWLHRPQRIFLQLGLEIDRTPKTKSFLGHFLRGLWYGQFKFKRVYLKQQAYKDGWPGFKFAFLRGLYAFLLQFFVGLKPKEGYKYWENIRYNIEHK